MCRHLPLIASAWFTLAVAQQPRVTTLEQLPSPRASNIVALPEGSPWCDGQPTAWFPGHKNHLLDRPSCKIGNQWTRAGPAVMDVIDDLNALDDPTVIDRHGCGAIDVNNDGLVDLYCMVGANVGRGEGYNELYLSQRDGSIKKVRRHALQRFVTARTRHTTILKDVNGTEMVFISASFGERDDGRPNKHAMFRKNGSGPDVHWTRKYFDYVPGPWHDHSRDTCALTIDANQDSRDDLLICNEVGHAMLFVQKPDGGFEENIWNTEYNQRHWRGATVADFSGDGIPDLAVVMVGTEKSRLQVFWGTPKPPYFDFFGGRYYELDLPFAAPDLEAFDADGDGVMDIYVVQNDERRRNTDGSDRAEETYCAGQFNTDKWWPGKQLRPMMPPDDYVPPRDTAKDYLFLGVRGQAIPSDRFRQVRMNHAVPGCGYFVKKFESNSLLLAHGGFDRPGHQVLLEW